MGVKDLWGVLSPSCEKKSLWELQGLNIAIDLSSWIVDSQSINDNTQINIYLRNLFFRTSYLLFIGVKPIFILEGQAPKLKHGTIARRQETLKDGIYKKTSKCKNGNRGRLNCLQKRCQDLLLAMGVPCYKSEGEAEALCSKLNELGVVSAVISQDSDCFLYGAQVVLRNFTMSPSYTCDMYTIENIKTKLNLGRQKLLALSLLCGCDYDAGVEGVGKQSALKFLATLPDDEVLNRLRSWRDDGSYDSQRQLPHMTEEEKIEHKIRKKALLNPDFPSEEVISEFLLFNSMELPTFVWGKPSLPKFMVIAERFLAWENDYIQSKFIPLLSRWHLLHGGGDCGLKLESIVKKRSVRNMPSYELCWQYDGISGITTTEPAHLIEQVYPDLHEAYIKSTEKTKAGVKRRKKKAHTEETEIENIDHLLGNLSISVPTKKHPVKKRTKEKGAKGLQTLDRFFLKERLHLLPEDNENTNPTVISHSTPVRNAGCIVSHQSDENDTGPPLHNDDVSNTQPSDSDVEHDAYDLSGIINSIINRTSGNPAVNIWSNNVS